MLEDVKLNWLLRILHDCSTTMMIAIELSLLVDHFFFDSRQLSKHLFAFLSRLVPGWLRGGLFAHSNDYKRWREILK